MINDDELWPVTSPRNISVYKLAGEKATLPNGVLHNMNDVDIAPPGHMGEVIPPSGESAGVTMGVPFKKDSRVRMIHLTGEFSEN